MVAKEIKTRTIMYEQQLDYLSLSIDEIDEMLKREDSKRKNFRYGYVIHDMDTDKDGNLVKPHLHVMVQLGVGQQWTLDKWADLFQDKPQQITKWKGQFETGISYLMHDTDNAVAMGKYHYQPDDVVANMDMQKFVQESQKRLANSIKATVNNALMRLDAGVNTLDELAAEMLGKEKVDFLRKAKTIVEYKQSLEDTVKQIRVYYIYGNAGKGKTRLANEFLGTDDVFITGSARDPYAGYKGESKVLWDDARFKGGDASEILRLTDPFGRKRTVGSRFHDKSLNNCEVMYITAIVGPNELWKDAFPDEPYTQFRRRLEDVYHVKDDGTYEIESSRQIKNLPWVNTVSSQSDDIVSDSTEDDIIE